MTGFHLPAVFVWWLLCCLVGQGQCKESSTSMARKILVTNVGASGSQNLVMARLADKLAERGNDVTVLQYDVLPNMKKIKLKHAKLISFIVSEDVKALERLELMTKTAPFEEPSMMNPNGMKTLFSILSEVQKGCTHLLHNHTKLVEQLKSEHYDAIVIHTMDLCTFGLTAHLGIKATAWFSTAFFVDPMVWFSGAAAPSSYVPAAILEASDQMTFFQRLKNLFAGAILGNGFELGMVNAYNKIFQTKFGADYPRLQELISETQLFIVNSDSFFEYTRPLQANVIEIGGFTMTSPEPLKSDWVKLLDNAQPDGVVIFSLGTVANTSGMPAQMKNAFVNGFKRFPRHTFIMRIEGDFPEAKQAPNIHLTTWLPQKDLLAHPKVKAFITHGGYNSLTEATYLGIPLIMMPLFGDQGPNAKRVERLGLGVTLDKNTVTEQDVYNALDTVLRNPEVARKAAHIARLMQNKPFSSEQTAMRWIEFLADFKDLDVLKSEARHMSFVRYHNLDVFAFLHVVAGVFLYISYRVVRCCYRRLTGKGQAGASKKKRQ